MSVNEKEEFYKQANKMLDEIEENDYEIGFYRGNRDLSRNLQNDNDKLIQSFIEFVNTPKNIKLIKLNDKLQKRILNKDKFKLLTFKIKYDNGEFEQYRKQELEHHLIPDLANIVQEYSINYCSMLSEEGSRCGAKAVYIKSIDGTEYRQDCKKYCQEHCDWAIEMIFTYTPFAIEFSNKDRTFILFKDDINLKVQMTLKYDDNNFTARNANLHNKTIICDILKKYDNVNITVSLIFKNKIKGDYNIKFLDANNEYTRFVKSKGWKVDPEGKSISVEYVISHKV